MILMGMNDEADEDSRVHRQESVVRPRHLRQEFRNHDPPAGRIAQQLSTHGDKRLLALADDLGTRLLPAFNSPTGMPYVYVNLKTGAVRGEVTNPAEVGTLLIEFGTLSKLTGKSVYYEKAKRALVEVYNRRSPIGLVGSSINVKTGEWTDPTSHISGGIDSYYEYLAEGVAAVRRQRLRAHVEGEHRRGEQVSRRPGADRFLVRPGEHEYRRPHRH